MWQVLALVVVAAVATLSSPVIADTCVPGDPAGTVEQACGFYSCVEGNKTCGFQQHCGPKGYPIGYGLKYCSRFHEDDYFSKPGHARVWMRRVLKCLQQMIVKDMHDLPPPPQRCAALEAAAFDSHPACYVNSAKELPPDIYVPGGISACDLSLSELWHLASVLDFKDALSKKGRKQLIHTIHLCYPLPEWALMAGSTARLAAADAGSSPCPLGDVEYLPAPAGDGDVYGTCVVSGDDYVAANPSQAVFHAARLVPDPNRVSDDGTPSSYLLLLFASKTDCLEYPRYVAQHGLGVGDGDNLVAVPLLPGRSCHFIDKIRQRCQQAGACSPQAESVFFGSHLLASVQIA